MATISGFGFSGLDHFGTLYEQGLNLGANALSSYLNSKQSFAANGKDARRNLRYTKRLIRFQNEQSKGLSLWSAHNMPSATMQGLRAAGLNPLLAAGGNTNVAPMVASSAESAPYSESYTPGNAPVIDASSSGPSDMFLGTTIAAKRADRETAKATLAEQHARREFFESDEGRKAVRDKLRMQYGPQSTLEAATLGAHSAGDAASAIQSARDDGTSNQLLSWLQDKGNDFDRWFWEKDNPKSHYYDGARRKRTYRSRDSHNRYHINFNFGSSAQRLHNYDTGTRTNMPVWHNPDLR